MSSLLLILLSAVLVSYYAPLLLGGRVFIETDPFFNAVGIAIASLAVIAAASPLGYLLEHLLLVPFHIAYLRALALVILIMILVQFAAMLMPRWGWTPIRPTFAMSMSAHSAVLGVALRSADAETFTAAVLMGLGIGATFAVLLLAFTTLHARVSQADVPAVFRDAPIALISAGLMALALMGLTGLVHD